MSDIRGIVSGAVGAAVGSIARDLTPMPVAAAIGGLAGRLAPKLYGNWIPALFMPHQRSIGGIIAQVTIEESGTDDLTITEHPVEQGAPIADHSFKRPSTITIRAGWTQAGSYDLSAESGVYGLLLSWQAALLPFDVITGKRRYTNMLMERLTVTTDQHSEFALMADIVCRQVIIVKTQTANADTQSDSASNHENAEETAPETNNGEQSSRDVGDGKVVKATSTSSGGDYGGGGDGPQRPPEGGDDTGLAATPRGADAQKLEITGTANTSARGMAEKGMVVDPASIGQGFGGLMKEGSWNSFRA